MPWNWELPTTATRDLSHLEQLGVLKRTGRLRATRYVLELQGEVSHS